MLQLFKVFPVLQLLDIEVGPPVWGVFAYKEPVNATEELANDMVRFRNGQNGY